MADALRRPLSPLCMLIPESQKYFITPSDRRLHRNIDSVKQTLQTIVNDRRKGLTSASDGSDMLSIMLESDVYKNNDEMLIQDMVSLFIAGFKTLQQTTTNMMYYILKHDDYRQKLMDEIRPPLDNLKGNVF